MGARVVGAAVTDAGSGVGARENPGGVGADEVGASVGAMVATLPCSAQHTRCPHTESYSDATVCES